MIQMNSLLRISALILFFSLTLGSSEVWAKEEGHDVPIKAEGEPKAEGEKAGEKSEEKSGDKKGSAPKSQKSWNRPKASSTKPSSALSPAGTNGRAALAQASGCLVDPAALEDLKRLKDELEDRKKDIESKESDLKARELVIADELKNLEKIRDEIARNGDQKAKDKEARVAKLVETFVTMNPKAAAKVLAALEDSLAVLSMSKMDTLRLAKIMNNMEPTRSSHLAEMLAGVKKNKDHKLAKKGDA